MKSCLISLRIKNWTSVADPGCLFILDPNFFHLRSRIRIFSIPDPGSASKNFSILTQNFFSKLSEIWFWLFIPDPDPDFLPFPDPGSRGQKGTGSWIQGSKRHRIPDPGIKKAPDPGSGSATLNWTLVSWSKWREWWRTSASPKMTIGGTGNTWLIIHSFRFCGPWSGLELGFYCTIKIFKTQVKNLDFFSWFRISYCN